MNNILITGSEGFIGKNLKYHLKDTNKYNVYTFNKENTLKELRKLVNKADFIFHLAGVNRTHDVKEFDKTNYSLTQYICDIISNKKTRTDIFFSSSTQSDNSTEYGISKSKAEDLLLKIGNNTKNSVYISKLPNVFGKWSKPNYNSVVATFCYNISRELKVDIHDGSKEITLLYIDDLIETIIKLINKRNQFTGFIDIKPTKNISLRKLYTLIKKFSLVQQKNFIPNLGSKFNKNIYSTFLSFLPKEKFSYNLNQNIDKRGRFVEFLKTQSSGQVSFFTAKKDVIRGGHYHHTKTEKFLVLQGTALFRFIDVITKESFSIKTNYSESKVVETIPGWAHNIKNVGEDDLIVMLWANERFDKENPDTFFYDFKINSGLKR